MFLFIGDLFRNSHLGYRPYKVDKICVFDLFTLTWELSSLRGERRSVAGGLCLMSLPPPPSALLVTEDILPDLVGRFIVMLDSEDTVASNGKKEEGNDPPVNDKGSDQRDPEAEVKSGEDSTETKPEVINDEGSEGKPGSTNNEAPETKPDDKPIETKIDVANDEVPNGTDVQENNQTDTTDSVSAEKVEVEKMEDDKKSEEAKESINKTDETVDSITPDIDVERIESESKSKDNIEHVDNNKIKKNEKDVEDKDKATHPDNIKSEKLEVVEDSGEVKTEELVKDQKENTENKSEHSAVDVNGSKSTENEVNNIKEDSEPPETKKDGSASNEETIKEKISNPQIGKPKKGDVKSKLGKTDKKPKSKKSVKRIEVDSDQDKDIQIKKEEPKTTNDEENHEKAIIDLVAENKSEAEIKEEKIGGDDENEDSEQIQEDDVTKTNNEDGLIEDQKIKNDIKETIIDIESVMKFELDNPEEVNAKQEKEEVPLERKGSMKIQNKVKNDGTSRTYHITQVEEDYGTIAAVPKVKFNMEDFVETSKSSSYELTSTMSHILITYQVGKR